MIRINPSHSAYGEIAAIQYTYTVFKNPQVHVFDGVIVNMGAAERSALFTELEQMFDEFSWRFRSGDFDDVQEEKQAGT
jgi:hypothetical protein